MGTTVTSRRLAIMLRATLTKEGRAGRALVEWAEEHRSVFWPALKQRARDSAKEKSDGKISWAKLATLVADMAEDPLPAELAEAVENIATVLNFGPQDRAVLEAGLALSFHPRMARLSWALEMAHEDMARVAGMLAKWNHDLARKWKTTNREARGRLFVFRRMNAVMESE